MQLPQTVKIKPNEFLKFQEETPEGHTFIFKYWDEFVEDYLFNNRSICTVNNCRDAILMILRNSHLRSIEGFNHPKRLKDAMKEIQAERGFKPITFNGYIKNIRTYFIWLEQYMYIEDNHLRRISKVGEETRDQMVLHHNSVLKVIAQNQIRKQTRLERLRNALFLDMLRFLGARPIELEGMTLEDNIKKYGDGYQIVIKGAKQKGKIRRFKMPLAIHDSLLNYMEYRRKIGRDEKYLFVSQSKRTGWTRAGMRRFMKQISKELGEDVNCYGFRRYVATTLHGKGASLEDIGYHLGHRRTSTTKLYIENSCAVTQKTTDMLSHILQG